jgi:hypothetical protein
MRYTRLVLLALVGATGASSIALGQPTTFPRPELRPFAGVLIPTGDLRNDFKAATMLGGQAALEMTSNVHLLGSFAWTHGHTKFAGFSDDLTYIYQYDAGVELNLVRPLGSDWLFRPFTGVGGGARTYDYKANGVGSKTCTSGYGTLGAEFQRRSVAIRLEGRNFLTCFQSPLSGTKKTRNDIGISLGLAYHLK